MAFMGAAEIRKDRFGLLLDIVYADFSTTGQWVQGRIQTSTACGSGCTPSPAPGAPGRPTAPSSTSTPARASSTPSLSFGVDTRNLGSRDGDVSLDWTNAIVGVRGATPLTERWSVSGFADVGGFDASDDLSWEIYGGMNYAFTDAWAGTIGYRYMSILYQATDRAKLDIDIQGPVFGITYKF